jgi:preprotein translocase subunit SecD
VEVAKITVSPARPAGAGELAAAATVIRRRAAALELQHLQVTVSGPDLVLTGPEPSQAQLASLIAGGVLRFRPVLVSAPYAGTPAPASPGPGTTGPPYGDASKVNAATMRLFGKLACKPGPDASTVNDDWKATAGYTPAQPSWDNPGNQVVSCDASGAKYVLDKAVVEGTDVTSARASFQAPAQWVIILMLNAQATAAFATLTTSQYNSYFSGASTNPNDAVLDSTAVVLDGNVLSAPQIQQPITAGQVQISGSQPAGFTRAGADRLAALLQGGPLPEGFKITAIRVIAPAAAH